MPDFSDFVRGFGLIENTNYNGFLLTNIQGTHNTIIRYKKYSYTITLKYKILKNKNIEEFYNNLVFTNRVINSAYHNPYNCELRKDNYSINGDILTVNLIGESNRI
jgi:hypothetical protein